MTKFKTTVLGAGSWGTALALVLSQKNDVSLWNYNAETLKEIQNTGYNHKYLPNIPLDHITIEYDLKTAVQNKDFVIIAVTSSFYKELLTCIAPFISENQIIISATKGLELNPFRTLTSLAEEMLPHKKAVVALSGPSHAEEVSMKKFTCLVASSTNTQANDAVQQCMSNQWIRIYTNTDPIGVEIGAAVKNIIAIAAGIVTAADLGDNALAAVITRGLAEMTRLGVHSGADPHTFSGLAGIGDLAVTCYSKHSRNRYVGQQIVTGKKASEITASMTQIPEGLRAVRQLHNYAIENNISMPIVQSVYKILYEDLSLEDWKNLLTERPLTNENNFLL
ncbi:MAG: NAD(P)H-dependent glycerol-3-phosphate dehydrogenase [Brevinemataceae bacterium]